MYNYSHFHCQMYKPLEGADCAMVIIAQKCIKKITTPLLSKTIAFTHTHGYTYTQMQSTQAHLSARTRGEKVFPQIAESMFVI